MLQSGGNGRQAFESLFKQGTTENVVHILPKKRIKVKMENVNEDLRNILKAQKKVWVKPTSKKKGHYRTVESKDKEKEVSVKKEKVKLTENLKYFASNLRDAKKADAQLKDLSIKEKQIYKKYMGNTDPTDKDWAKVRDNKAFEIIMDKHNDAEEKATKEFRDALENMNDVQAEMSTEEKKAVGQLKERSGIKELKMRKAELDTRHLHSLLKAKQKGGKYKRRIPKAGGGFTYVYEEKGAKKRLPEGVKAVQHKSLVTKKMEIKYVNINDKYKSKFNTPEQAAKYKEFYAQYAPGGKKYKGENLKKAENNLYSLLKGEKAVATALKHPDKLGKGAKKRKKLKTKEDKVAAVMREFKRGTLRSGSGAKVTDVKQAQAIAMSESGQSIKKAEKLEAEDNLFQLLKAQRGGKYIKRIPKAGGGYTYIYEEKKVEEKKSDIKKQKHTSKGSKLLAERHSLKELENKVKQIESEAMHDKNTGNQALWKLILINYKKALEYKRGMKKAEKLEAEDNLFQLLKAQRGGKYIKRIPKAGGGFTYVYKKGKRKEKDRESRDLGDVRNPRTLTDKQIENNIIQASKIPLKKLRKNQDIIDLQLEKTDDIKIFESLETRREIYTAAVAIKEFKDKPKDWIPTVKSISERYAAVEKKMKKAENNLRRLINMNNSNYNSFKNFGDLLKATLPKHEIEFYKCLNLLNRNYNLWGDDIKGLCYTYNNMRWSANAIKVMQEIEKLVLLRSGRELEKADSDKIKGILNQAAKSFAKDKNDSVNKNVENKVKKLPTLIKAQIPEWQKRLNDQFDGMPGTSW
jgi:hypothetical protein